MGTYRLTFLTESYFEQHQVETFYPSVREMLQILDASGAELYACELAMNMFRRKKEDLVKEVITAGDFVRAQTACSR